MIDQRKLDEFMNQVKKIEKGHQLDLSSDEDLSIGIMNLISIEEHLFFTANKTGKKTYYDLLFDIREMRKELLKEIIKDYEGEVWCISKHLLASSMRLMEVGTKALGTDQERAYRLFEQSYNLYNLFWALNLKMIGDDKQASSRLSPAQREALVKQIEQEAATIENNTDTHQHVKKNITITNVETSATTADSPSTNPTWKKLGQVLNKMLDCCRE